MHVSSGVMVFQKNDTDEPILQSRNRNTDIENKHMDIKGGKWGWDELGDLELTYTHCYV